ncbi:MAG: DUF2934 domain-containing protein [Planctomycetales bacterium]|nr:DUF2934 domain-containing protein [Planctomycetales bacterium]
MTKSKTNPEVHRATSDNGSISIPDATVVPPAEQGGDSDCPSKQQPANACEEAIRVLAHEKWEAAGCPVGDGFDFWIEAEREVKAMGPGPDSTEGQRPAP